MHRNIKAELLDKIEIAEVALLYFNLPTREKKE